MKKIFFMMLLVALFALPMVLAGVDWKCEDLGYGPLIVKFNYEDTDGDEVDDTFVPVIPDGSQFQVGQITLSPDNNPCLFEWTSNMDLDGYIVMKAGQGVDPVPLDMVYYGQYDCDGDQAISNIQFCGARFEIPELTIIGAIVSVLVIGFVYMRKIKK